jgi:hypothetical protein
VTHLKLHHILGFVNIEIYNFRVPNKRHWRTAMNDLPKKSFPSFTSDFFNHEKIRESGYRKVYFSEHPSVWCHMIDWIKMETDNLPLILHRKKSFQPEIFNSLNSISEEINHTVGISNF